MRPYRCNALALSGADHQLKKDLPLEEIERIIAEDNPWVRFVPNEREASMEQLTPVAASGSLEIPVAACVSSLWAPSTLARSPWVTSCCGALLSRFAVCCRLLLASSKAH